MAEKTFTMDEIVDRLIGGPISPVGETNTDEVRLARVDDVADLADHLIRMLHDAADSRTRHEASMRAIGKRAHGRLRGLSDWLRDLDDEDGS